MKGTRTDSAARAIPRTAVPLPSAGHSDDVGRPGSGADFKLGRRSRHLPCSRSDAGSGRCRPLFRNDVAQPLRFDVAQRSEMISPSVPR
jgi:hypothetical protein